jgi:6-pyruvoyltetrahydropterin/6-carboxytetrahydropterin synthase
MKAHLTKILYFEAAHRNHGGEVAQQRLHGHSYKVEILASGPTDLTVGWVVDFAELKKLFMPVYEQLDHAYLNELPGLEADSSLHNLKRWIEARIPDPPAWFKGVRLSIDGDLAFAPVYLPEEPREKLPPRVRFTFEAAQSLPQLPDTHPCQKLHGHSYTCEIGAEDLEDLAVHLGELYDELDHRYLNEVEGLGASTTEHICRWIWKWVEARGTTPTVVVIQETYTARCIYFGED